MYLWWSFCISKCWSFEVEFTYLVLFTHMPRQSYCWRLRSLLLCLCDVFRALINKRPQSRSLLTEQTEPCVHGAVCAAVLLSKPSGRINDQFLQSETERGPERSCRINTQNEKYRRRLRSLLLCLCFHYFLFSSFYFYPPAGLIGSSLAQPSSFFSGCDCW